MAKKAKIAVDFDLDEAGINDEKKPEQKTAPKASKKKKPKQEDQERYVLLITEDCETKIKELKDIAGMNMQPHIRKAIYPLIDKLHKQFVGDKK